MATENPKIQPSQPAPIVINYDEPPTKPPPLLSSGPLAWMRDNLFSSSFDTILTIIGAIILVGVTFGLISWAVREGDWFAVTFNVEQYLAGRFDDEEVWRLGVLMLFVTFTAGVAIAAFFRRISPIFIGGLALIYLPLLLVPVMVNATIPLPPSYIVASNVPIVSGTLTEDPIPEVAFTAAAGETLTFRFADQTGTDEELSNLAGFVDDPANALRTAARARLENIARFAELDLLISEDTTALEAGDQGLFIPPQREIIQREYERLLYTPPEEDQLRIEEINDLLASDDALRLAIAAEDELLIRLAETEDSPIITPEPIEGEFGEPRVISVTGLGELGGVLRLVLLRDYEEVRTARLNVGADGTAQTELSEENLLEPGYYIVHVTQDDVVIGATELGFVNGDTQPQPLSDEERAILEYELARISTPPSIVNTYDLNEFPVAITVLDSDGNPLPEGTQILEPGDGMVQVSIPDDSWYILRKEMVEEAESVALLAVDGIYPLFRRSVGVLRVTDGFEVRAPIPRTEANEDYPFQNLTENKYRGDRPLTDYMRLYLAPFFTKPLFTDAGAGISLQASMAALLVAGVLGFGVARWSDRTFVATEARNRFSRKLANWLLLSTPFVMFLLIIGADLLALSMLISWAAYTMLAYYIGLRMGPALGGMTVLAVVLVYAAIGTLALHFAPMLIYGENSTIPAIVATLFGGGLTSRLPFVFSALLTLPAIIAIWYGAGQRHDYSEGQLRRLLIIAATAAVIFYVAPVLYNATVGFDRGDADSLPNLLIHSDPRDWGGLLLAGIVTVYGILLAFPLGIALALGRRSSLPALKIVCTLIIELVRGTPFIVVLFAGMLLIPLVNPAFAEIPNAYRALAATVLFIAAYLAENVRGGLQSIPPGQAEAARAVGLTDWQITLFIMLPQALRAVIPALVGQFISLFKDTSLLAIVGLIDLTGVVNQVVVAQEFIGTRRENLLFITIIYFVLSYIMSWVSRRIEESGSGSVRRI